VRQVNLGRLRRGFPAGCVRWGMLVALFVGVSCAIGVASAQADGGPSNTLPPTIAGIPTQGQTLTETQGTWTNSPTLTDQWEDCDSSGADCLAIAGATTQTYTLTAADVGQTIVVAETATNAGGPPVIQSSTPTAAVAAAPPPPPANMSPPTIAGTPTQGQTLTETQGTWTNSPTLTDQWEDCDSSGADCLAISGATTKTYTLTSTDVGHTIVVQETATNAGGPPVIQSSTPTAAVAAAPPPPPTIISLPTISGSPTQGQTLTETNGAWTNSPTSYTNQWEDCDASGQTCTLIAGATLQTYVPTAADVGHTIALLESAGNAGGTSATVSAAATATVAAAPPPPPANMSPPTIAGIPTQGQTLTETQGTWTNSPTLTDQWEDCDSSGANCLAITGATTQTYTLTAADVGQTIVVQETATNATGSTIASSNPTDLVAPALAAAVPAPAIKTAPTISGTTTQGQPLTETNGTWNNSPTTVTNQWEDCDGSGAGCTAITGATLPTYRLTAGDVGHTIVVQETATNATGFTIASSNPTGVVTGLATDPPPATPSSTISPSSTALTVVPNTAVTNQDVILGATVASAATPVGTITFEDDGAPIGGCSRLPVNSQPTIVSCETSFSALTSPEQLTAAFAPNPASGSSSAAASTSSTHLLVVGRDSTSTTLRAPSTSVRVGARTTYTASVTPSNVGSVHGSGTVEFLDRGTPITSCAARPLLASNGATTATCTISYKTTGKHVITAAYGGDANFSASTATPVNLGAIPIRILGTITSTMQWTFHYTPSYTNVLALVLESPPIGATVLLECHGRGCPFAKRARAVTKHEPINLMHSFNKQRLRAGTQIIVELTRPGWIGQDYLFTTRARRGPRIQVACLAPGGTRPGAGC